MTNSKIQFLVIALALVALALSLNATMAAAAEFDFPGIPAVAKEQVKETIKNCGKRAKCFNDAITGLSADANYWFEKALKNLPADVRTAAWSRCKAMASSKDFDYVEGALGCQNVVSRIFLERKDDFKPVSAQDGHGSALMFAFATRVAQLSILARGCEDALKTCQDELKDGVNELPTLADLGDPSIIPYDPDPPPLPPQKVVTAKEAKGIVATVKRSQKELKQGPGPKDKKCDPPQNPSLAAGSSGHEPGDGSPGATGPQYPTGFDFVGPQQGGSGNGNGTGGGGNGNGNGLSTDGHTVGFGKPGDRITLNRTGPRDPGGLQAALEARDQASGGVPNRLPGTVSAVRDAASSELAPEEGSAVFTVVTDANGKVTDVSVSGANAEQWQKVAPVVKAALANARARMMEGGKGLKVSIAVEAAYRNPSGTKAGHKIGGPSVDQGSGAVNLLTFDVTDIGAHATRQVHAHLIEEQTLY